ncbi:PAS domain S-box protein [Nocardioides sp. HDW12B]|uniref:ATP-binding protein n=1 Tax=Nocardioides sp. HDW12B TaxID=2714939 RepID=UPI00140DF20C|nr:ATP-binding protein [Nocardioides sp. HDW12B]QIK67724.1 PAS domain S-box protein [Nocardioides sp. HDW12B]
MTWVRRLGRHRVLGLVVLAVLALEVVFGQMAVRFAPPGSSVAAYWPNSGLSVVALILSSRRWRPATLGGVFLVTVLANLLGGRDLQVSAGFAMANAAEAGLAFWLLAQARDEPPVTGHGSPGPALSATGLPADRPDDDRPRLESVEDFIRLFVACAFASALGAVLAGATIGLLQDGDALVTGRAVLASHLASMLLIVPLSMRLPRDREHAAGPAEVLVQWATLTLVVGAVFFGTQGLPLVFLIYPILVWGALRAEPWVTALQLLVAGGAVAVLTTTRGGPYLDAIRDAGQPPELAGTLLQAHLLASALVTLPLALIKAQRLLALAEVTRSHEELDAILAATTATAIVGIGLDGRVEYVNVGAQHLSGYQASALLGRARVVVTPGPEPLLTFAEDGTGPSGEAPLREVVDPVLDASDGTVVQDWGFLRADGARLTVSVALSRRYAANGTPAGYLAVAEDVTERRQQEREVKEALASEKLVVDRLAQLDQTKNDFLSTVSHELRTPITSILGYSQLLMGQDASDLPAIQRQVVGRIERNGRRLMGLIEDMLAMSQIEVGSFGFTRVPLDAREPLALAVESTLPLLPARDLALEQRVSTEPVLVAGDADKLERAFENLLSNAVKFSNPGEQIVVRLAAEAGEAVFSVTDTGIGIESEDQEQLFDRFFRGSEAQTQAIQGAGLGLSIAATIVNGHDGSIDIESAPGRGSTFTIRLPLLEEV